jgi:hypothetical protein
VYPVLAADQAKALVARAGLGRRKGKAQIGLGRGVTDRIGACTEPVQRVTHLCGDCAEQEEALIAAINGIIRQKIGRMRSVPCDFVRLPCGSWVDGV